MSKLGLKDQIEEILSIIGAASRALSNGAYVDLTALEGKVGALHETIAKDPSDTGGIEPDDLMSYLNSIMDGLDKLDRDLRASMDDTESTDA